MIKYAKYISENKIELAPTNYKLEDGTILFNFNTNPELMLQYGFKHLTEVERPETGRMYKITYTETTATVDEILTYTETEEEYKQRVSNNKKAENDSKCSEALENGLVQIEGWEVHSFTTTTPEIVELNLAYGKMQDDETYTIDWHSSTDYGVMLDKTNTAALLSSIWTYRAAQRETHATYTTQIDACTTVEEINAIIIIY